LPQKNQTTKGKWENGIESELRFWDNYFRTKGLQWSDYYGMQFDPTLSLQQRAAALLPDQVDVYILDVGAGPLTFLGKTLEGKQLHITAVDALADEYDRILEKYKIEPLVRTEKLDAEMLTNRFAANTFDLVFARNCIDHSYDPELSIRQMVTVVKVGCYLLMEHNPDEADTRGYSGLHQWNFSMNDVGEFLIRSRQSEVNVTQKYRDLCTVTCECVTELGERWLITKFHKK